MVNSDTENLVHGTSLFLKGKTLLIQGPSGIGKSDLALRLVYEQSAQLIADDYTLLKKNLCKERNGFCWTATYPPETKGLLEVREVGIVKLPSQRLKEESPLDYIITLSKEKLERLPEERKDPLLDLPVFALPAFTASLISKVLIINEEFDILTKSQNGLKISTFP